MKHKFYWLNPKLKVTKTKKYGYGTFAKQDVNKGERLLVLSGYVMRLQDEEKLPGSLSDNGIQITEDLSICVSTEKELGGINYFNHSCDPNAGIKGQIFLVAMKKIPAGQEVTFDYAMTLCQSKNAKPYHLECLCGKRNCRKIITDSDWENTALQKKYDGYFQYYIQEKIDRKKTRKK
ncbi:MAG: SET domain-containing protein [Candidatus Paceibacterota bacterium]